MKTHGKRLLLGCLLFLAAALTTGIAHTDVRAAKLPALRVSGTKLVDSDGQTVRLKGVSTHGLAWYPKYVNQKAFKYMKKNWKINTVRLALYTAEYNGYCTGGKANRKKLLKKVEDGISYATKAGLYVIVDWHVLNDQNPKTYQKQAVKFFKTIAEKYKNNTNVLYEICNEPNGGTSWDTIREYAQEVIGTIRGCGNDSVILVGTPNWSQDVDTAAQNPLEGDNLMYSLHFYAGTHKDWLRDKAQTALNQGLPLFVSEFAICDASGNGALDKTEGKKWMEFLDRNDISCIGWNLSNKNESSALIRSSVKKSTGWTNKNLSSWGKWLIKQFKK